MTDRAIHPFPIGDLRLLLEVTILVSSATIIYIFPSRLPNRLKAPPGLGPKTYKQEE